MISKHRNALLTYTVTLQHDMYSVICFIIQCDMFRMNGVQNQTFIQSSVSYCPDTIALMNAQSNHFKEKRPNLEVLNPIFGDFRDSVKYVLSYLHQSLTCVFLYFHRRKLR